eukprot:2683584-Pyramimonas_sp.AAC.1
MFGPIFGCMILLVKRYASMIWDGEVSLADDYHAWRCAADRYAQSKPNWQMVRGPAAAARLTLHRINWQVTSPADLIDDL